MINGRERFCLLISSRCTPSLDRQEDKFPHSLGLDQGHVGSGRLILYQLCLNHWFSNFLNLRMLLLV